MAIFCLDYYSVLIVATKKQFGETRQAWTNLSDAKVVGFSFAIPLPFL